MVESDEVRRASHFPEEHWKPRLHVKLRVRVVLLGLGGGDGSDTPFVLHPKMLQRVLREVLPTYKVPLIEHRKQGRNPLDIECDISYMVKHAGIDSNERYLDVMARAAVRSNVDYPSLLVSIEGISQAVEAIAEKESGVLPRDQEQIFGDTDVTLLVANPNRVELRRRVETLGLLLPNDDIPGVGVEYSFAEPLGSHSREGSRGGRTKASTCACSWVGQGRVLVLDLGSVACNFGAVRQDTPHSIVSKSTFPSGTSSWGEEHWLLSRAQSKSISSSQEERWEKGGTATGGDINDLSEILRNVQNLGSSANSDGAAVFVAKLSSVLVSAVRTVLVPAVPAVPSSPGKVNGHPIVMVPVLLFRRKGGDGGMGEAKEDENIDSNILAGVVNMTHVSASIKAVGLPGEDVLTIGGVHFLDEHPQVAVALAKSVSTRASYIRSEATRGSEQAPHYKVREEGYVDSTNLFMEIKSAGDTLTSALLSDAGVDALVTLDLALEAGKATKDILGTTDGTIDKDKNQVLVHTLPVFVLSATEHSPPTDRREVVEGVQSMGRPAHLFDNDQVFAAQEGGGVVLVLQAETSTLVPFFEESGNGAMDMIEINLEDATSGVVAGLLTALHGLAPPHEWWSPGSEKMSLDFTWSHGYHPFAPFGFVKGLPGALFVDIAHRNAVASSLAVAASSLSKAIDTLDNFGRSAIPGELLLGEQRASLSTGGGSARAGWGSALSTAAEDSGIPVSHVYHVLSVQHLVSATVERLEGEAEVLPGKRVSEAVNVVKGLERRAQDVLRQVQLAVSEDWDHLQCCQPTLTERVGNPNPVVLHVCIFGAILLVVVYVTKVVHSVLVSYVGGGTGWDRRRSP
ncbi:unnamed protein product [Choristocarpus tenellus]